MVKILILMTRTHFHPSTYRTYPDAINLNYVSDLLTVTVVEHASCDEKAVCKVASSPHPALEP